MKKLCANSGFSSLMLLVLLTGIGFPYASSSAETPPSANYSLPLKTEGQVSAKLSVGRHTLGAGVLYIEDFEDSDGGFTAENNVGNGWEWGTPVSWPEAAASGTKCWGTNLTGAVSHNANYNLYSPLIDLSDVPEGTPLVVRWMHAVSNDSVAGGPHYHRAYAYYSVDGGTWQSMWIQDGSPVEWSQETFDISAAAGNTVQFRWHMTTDSFQWTSAPGYFIDDVAIVSGTIFSDRFMLED